MAKLVRDKRSSLLRKVATYGRKKFYNIAPGAIMVSVIIPNVVAPNFLTGHKGQKLNICVLQFSVKFVRITSKNVNLV
jgi:hypothetical protein